MEVFILVGVGLAALLSFSVYLYLQNRKLKEETESLGSILDETIKDHERELEDHQESARELSVAKTKLETLKETTLTPDNSIPKEIHDNKVLELVNELSATKRVLEDTNQKYEKERGKAISDRVRLGQVGENFAAFHDQFPYDRKQVKALFQPVDLVCFEENEVVFIDVKTGGSQLSKKQRQIRDNIKEGRVRFEIHRLDENGYQIK